MAYRLALGETDTDYVFPNTLTYNLVSFGSSVPSAKLPRAHGARVPRGFLGERRIEIRGLLKFGTNGDTLQEQLDALRAGLMSGPTTLWLPNDRHLRNVQKENASDRYDQTWPERIVEVSADLITGDPFLYSDAESEDLNNAISASGDNVTVNNSAGNAPAAPTISLTVQGEGADFGEIPTTSNKGATEFAYTQSSIDYHYACLNGDVMTVYADIYGGLGVTPVSSGIAGAKAPGTVSPTTGQPPDANILADGQIGPNSGAIPSYGILRSNASTNALDSTELQVQERTELLTAGWGGVSAGCSVVGDSADLSAGSGDGYLKPTDGLSNDLSVSGATAGDALSATVTTVYSDIVTGDGSGEVLEVRQIWSFQNAETVLEKTRLKCRVEMENKTGSTLTNVRFCFALKPSPGITNGTCTHTFRVPADLTALAARSAVGDRYLGLGVYNTGPNCIGTRVGITTTNLESTLTSQPETLLDGGAYVELGSGTNASFEGATSDTTANFQTDSAWDAALYSANHTGALILLSPQMDIGALDTENFEFYIFTDTDQLLGSEGELSATITNETTGEAFTLNGTVEAGAVIEVDTLEETVTIEGEDRTDLFDGLFPLLNPGNNTLDIAFDSGEVTNVDVTWRNRWY